MSVIAVENLAKRFGAVEAVRDVSFDVRPGEIFGILGPNGAGKTTTLECIAGSIAPDAGRITILGVEPRKGRSLVRQRVGYQLQATMLPPALRVREALDLFAAFYSSPRSVPELLSLVGLREQARRPFGKLSGGEKQRLSIALAIIGSPEVAVFDELTTGLDPQGRREVWSLIRQIQADGVTVLLVSHYLDEAERLCDRLAVIQRGATVFLGTTSELIEQSGMGRGSPSPLEDAYVRLLETTADALGRE